MVLSPCVLFALGVAAHIFGKFHFELPHNLKEFYAVRLERGVRVLHFPTNLYANVSENYAQIV